MYDLVFSMPEYRAVVVKLSAFNGNTDLGQHWLINGFFPDSTKLLPEPMLTYLKWVLWHSHQDDFPGSTHEINMSDDCDDYTLKTAA